MPLRYSLSASLLALMLLCPIGADAAVYKCVAANGELTYSQTPCLDKESNVTKQSTGGPSHSESADCEVAHRFALSTAQDMRAGTGSSTAFDRYGGLSALSRGTVSLISYVYQFRTNADVSAERVAALATAKCQVRSFGDVSCEQLPVSFTNRLGGCGEENKTLVPEYSDSATRPMQLQQGRETQELFADSRAKRRDDGARVAENTRACKEKIRSQIDSINSQMRGGYSSSQGDTFRKRRRELEEKMRDC